MPTNSAEMAHHIGLTLGKLIDKQTRLREERDMLQKQEGSGFRRRLTRLNKIADELERLQLRIERTEKLQDHFLTT